MKLQYRPCETTRVTSPFGPRPNPMTKNGIQNHHGVDISPLDKVKYFHEPIFACANGKVTIAAFNKSRGNQVLIDHGEGVSTRSQHLFNMTVRAGQSVKAGDVIGHMGSTGDSTGQHLHFEVIINGVTKDPAPYIAGLPMYQEVQRSDNYKKAQLKYGFNNETMEYLSLYKYAEALFAEMLLPKDKHSYQLNTIDYILKYKYGKEVFAKLNAQ